VNLAGEFLSRYSSPKSLSSEESARCGQTLSSG
jgi:hypothetical protein